VIVLSIARVLAAVVAQEQRIERNTVALTESGSMAYAPEGPRGRSAQ